MSDWAKSNATRLMALETQRQETDARSQQEISILKLRRFRLFSGRRSQIETPAVEVNRVNEILFVPESPSCVFDPLDLRVERFARSIGDAMP